MEDAVRGDAMFRPCVYAILVEGALEPTWSERLGGLAVTVHELPDGPITTLSGPLLDQGALHGVLDTLYDLGLPVLSVTSA